MRAFLLCLLFAVPALAETLSFKPGEVSTSVKGTLVADQTREYVFSGKKGQQFEIVARSQRGQWLIVHVRDRDKKDVFNNFDSEELQGKGVLPSDGDYTIYLALRRPEVQREGRVDYQLTVTLHSEPGLVAIDGAGEYFVSDGGGTRKVNDVSVGLGQGGEVQVTLDFGTDGFTIKGTWERENDEAALLKLTEAFDQPVHGQGMVLFDDEIVDGGKPTHIMLRFDAPNNQNTHHTLYFGDD